MKAYLEKEDKKPLEISVTPYIVSPIEDSLFVKIPGYPSIVVDKKGQFKRSSTMNPRRDSLLTDREDVKAAVKAYLEKEKLEKESPKKEQSIFVADYIGNVEYKNCVYVSSPNQDGYVVNPNTREFMGFASTPESAITEKLDYKHPHMEAIKEHLFKREGILQLNDLTVSRFVGNSNYSNHVLVKTKNVDFIFCRNTRTVVGTITPDCMLTTEPFIYEEYLKDNEKAVIFYATINAFLRGERSSPLTLKDHLEPFRKEYLAYLNMAPNFVESNTYYSLVGKIMTTIPDEFVDEIFSMYPTLSRAKSMKMALRQFLGEH